MSYLDSSYPGNGLVNCVFSYGLPDDPAVVKEAAAIGVEATTAANVRHPLEQRFTPQLLMRYPLAPPPHPQATTNSSQPVSTLFATSTPAAANAGNRDPFPAYLEMFAFPEGVRLKSSSSPAADDIMASIGPEEAVYHSFVTTDSSGQRSYGVCLTCYQPIPVSLHPLMRSMIERWTKQQFQSSDIEYATHIQQKLTSERTVFQSTGDETVQEMIHLYRGLLEPYNKALMSADQLYGPVCVGMLSRWPMYGLFRDWLVRLMSEIRLKGSLNAPLERYIANLVHEMPVPSPGRMEIEFDWAEIRFNISRPPLNCIPLIRDFPLAPLFQSLSSENIVRLFELVVMEQKIILISRSLALLSTAAEAITMFLYPLTWQHIFIPVLPARLLNCLQAPVPFIIGIQDSLLTATAANTSGPDGDHQLPRDVAVVRLDSDSIENLDLIDELIAPKIFPKERRKLLSRIRKYSALYHTITTTNSTSDTTGVSGTTSTTILRRKAFFDRVNLNRPRYWTARCTQENERKVAAMEKIERQFLTLLHRLQEEQERLLANYRKHLPPLPPISAAVAGTQSKADLGEDVGSTDFLRFFKVLQRPSSAVSLNSAIIASDDCFDSAGIDLIKQDDETQQPSLSQFSSECNSTSMPSLSSQPSNEDKPIKSQHSIPSAKRNGTESNTGRLLSEVTSRVARQVSGIFDKASSKFSGIASGDNGKHLMSNQSSKTTIDCGDEQNEEDSCKQPDMQHVTITSGPKITENSTAIAAEVRILDVFHYYPLPLVTNTTTPDAATSDQRSSAKLSHIWSSYVPPLSRYRYLLDCEAVTAGGINGRKPSQQILQLCTLPHHPSDRKYVARFEVEGHQLAGVLVVYTGQSSGSVDPLLSLDQHHTASQSAPQSPQQITKSSSELHAIMSNLRLLKRTDSRGLLCRSSTNIVPTTIEIGLCAVCDRAVDAPLVLADGKVYTAKGMANFQEVEAGVSMETGYSNALACNGCRLLVHRSCMQSIDDHCRCVFDDLKIHETFFRFWTSVLRSYRSYLITPAVKSATNNCSLPSESATIAQKTAGQGGSVNNKTGKEHGSGGSSKKWALFPFISSSGTKSLPKQLSSDDVFHRSEFLEHAFHDYESRTFMRRLCETQAFAKFVYDRVDRPRFDYEVLFFDEAINAKLNRSLIKIHKEATPFLEDPAFSVHQKVMIGEPYGSSTQQKCFQYSELPRQLDASLLITKAVSMNGGEALSLVNDKDERRLQLYTCSLLRKSRIERLQKRRPDISDWVKTRIISNNSNGSKRDPTVPPPTAESEILAVNQQIEQIYGTILKITQDIETDPSDLQKKNSTSLQVLHRLLDESKKRALYASSLLPTNNCRNVTAAALIAKATFVDAEIQDISLLQSHIQYLLQSKPDSISTQISHQLPNMHQ